MSPLLDASGLAIGGRLQPSSIAARPGELVCLVGPNGSGKTSLLHAIAGIGGPAGEVRIDGHDPCRAGPDERRRLLSYLPATRDIAWPLAARDLIALGLSGGEGEAGIDRIVAELSLEDIAGRRIDRLSTGERSRVLIARALVARPRLLLLDEPVANLDPLWQLRLMDHLRLVTRRDGQAALIAAHDLDLAAAYADRLVVMRDGRIAAEGEPAELLASALIPEVFGIERRDGGWRPVA
ncbi:MAG TPA: ABC transporter ATP-binding protein [Allosphingosinicella sp.]